MNSAMSMMQNDHLISEAMERPDPNFPAFGFLEIVLGGITNRNHIAIVECPELPNSDVEAYSSLYRFRYELRHHVATTGSISSLKSVPVWADYLLIDIDGKKSSTLDELAENLEEPLQRARNIIANVERIDAAAS